MSASEERRARIVSELRRAAGPLPGSVLAERCGVSRQIVVGDVALLRRGGVPIVSTNRGYVLPSGDAGGRPTRLFKCLHTAGQTADELTCVVDLGACVEDVFVNHRVYGKISSPLGVRSRRDVGRFVDELASGVSAPLMEVTSGYHFHHVSAESEEVLDEVERALGARGFLVGLSDYEAASFA